MDKNKTFVYQSYERTDEQPRNIFCFSPFRWHQSMPRPKQILTRLSNSFDIFFIEDSIYDATDTGYLEHQAKTNHLHVITPHLPKNDEDLQDNTALQQLLDSFMAERALAESIFWYVNPYAYSYTGHLRPAITIFDCINELSFRYPLKEYNNWKHQLYQKADIVFTSSGSLYQSKKNKHPNFHILPCSVNTDHFSHARGEVAEAADQESLPFPRLGYIGSLDAHFDVELVSTIAATKPNWQIILIGPKSESINTLLNEHENVHYMGNKPYAELPSYLAGWNVALIPQKENKSTICTESFKAGEYLAAGVPVIATPLKEIKAVYEDNHLVETASNAGQFIEAAESILFRNAADLDWLRNVDEFLSTNCLDNAIADILKKIKETTRELSYMHRVA